MTRGLVSKNTVRNAYQNVQLNDSVRRPFDSLDLSNSSLTVILGSCIFHGPNVLIELDGQNILSIEPPEDGSRFPVISGVFSDREGNETLRIEKNIWSSTTTVWDVEVTGNEIIIRQGPRNIALHLVANPPHELTILKLDMYVGSAHICLRKDYLALGRISSDSEYYLELGRLECHGASIGVQAKVLNCAPTFTGLSMIGGKGLELIGTGLNIATGAGSMVLRDLAIEIATKTETLRYEYPLRTSVIGSMARLPPRL